MMAARIQPYAQKLSNSTSIRPRCLAGATSATSVLATGNSPPKPSPVTNRKASSAQSPQASAESPVAMEYTSMVAISTAFRPYRSASTPEAAAPTNIPNSPALIATPTCPCESPHSCANATITNDSNPTSIASNIQPNPASNITRRCPAPAGRASNRPSIPPPTLTL